MGCIYMDISKFDSAITTYNDYQLDRNQSALNMFRKYISENKHKQFPIISICQRDKLMNVCFCVYKSFIVNRFLKSNFVFTIRLSPKEKYEVSQTLILKLMAHLQSTYYISLHPLYF